ncbi:TIGR03086 family metal-binding protein [Glycomyces sp. NPDC046736]|uniref:TIGR03086 family metal-binding protein n=1 Tax=Glycomyces sp. NPDC046736 TaxID=3155615 RepID=UPI0033DAC9CF
MTDLLSFHRRTMTYAASIVDLVEPGQLGLATPCEAWDVGALLAHMTGQNRGFAAAARGEAFDPATWAELPVVAGDFTASANEVVAAFNAEGALDRTWSLLAGLDREVRVPGATALGYHFIDYVVHAWDLGVAIGHRVEFDPELLEAVVPLAFDVPLDGPSRNGPYAPFAAAVPAIPDSGPLEVLLAVLGRDPSWRP